jgi:hypothetical protein
LCKPLVFCKDKLPELINKNLNNLNSLQNLIEIECKVAIDRYFSDRNDFFRKFPKRAGKKIWGKESNKPVFDETQNFKDSKWR